MEKKIKIFQRFYRGEQARGQEGCGIGLYLSREIVLLQKGMMKAKQMKPGLLIEGESSGIDSSYAACKKFVRGTMYNRLWLS